MKRYAIFLAAAALAVALGPGTDAGAAEVRTWTAAEGLPSNWVTALASSPDGKVWVGTGNAGVYRLDPGTGKGERFGPGSGLAPGEVTSIALFQGKVYVGTASGLSVFDGARWSTIRKAENVTMRNVRLAASPDGKELWACSVYLAGGTVRFDGASWKFMGGEGRGLFNGIQGFAFGPEGVLMGAGSGTAFLHKGAEVVALKEGLPPVNVFSTGIRNGRWLLGTNRGLFEYDGKWTPVPLPGGFEGAAVFSLAVRDGQVVLGTDRGLLVAGEGHIRGLPRGAALPSPRVNSVVVTGDAVIAGTLGGVSIIR